MRKITVKDKKQEARVEARAFLGGADSIIAALREQQFRTLIENLPGKVFLKDRNSVYVSCNKSYALDLKIKPEEIAGKTDYDFYPTRLAEKYRADDLRLMDSGKNENIEEDYLIANDIPGHAKTVFINTVKVPVRDKAGNVVGIFGFFWDITGRKKAEDQVRNLNKQIEFILGATKTGLDIIDSDFNIVYVDPAWQKVYGNPAGKKCYKYFMGRSRECSNCGVRKALATKAVVVTEEILVKEGNRPIQVTTIPYQDKDGKWFVAEVNVDISERKKATDQIRRLATFPELNPLPICEISPKGKVIYRNSASKSLCAKLGQCPCGVDIKKIRKLFAAGKENSIAREMKVGGRWYMQTMQFMPVEGNIRIYSMDITDRKYYEDKIYKINQCLMNFGANALENIQRLTELCGDIFGAASALYNRLEKGMLYSVGKWNTPAGFDSVSKAEGHICCDVIRKSGKDMFVIRDLPGTKYARTDPNVAKYKLRTYVGHRVMRGVDSFGSLCVVYQKDIIFSESDKKILGIIATAVGIEEERLSAEGALKDSYAKLAQTQNELIQTEKMSALGKFATGVAHEVKNPLAIILGGIEFMERKIPLTNKDTKSIIDKIKKSAIKADNIIHSILQYARQSGLEVEEVLVTDFINELVGLFEYQAARRNIKIKVQVPRRDLSFKVDKNKMEQAFHNIILNAIEAMPHGGRILVRAYPLLSSESVKSGAVCIEVIDSGEGVPKENLEKLFEPFFTTKRAKKGVGLGLAITKMIVKSHGGIIDVYSVLNKGTTVKVMIPKDAQGGKKIEKDPYY